MKRSRHIFCEWRLVSALAAFSCALLYAAEPITPVPEISLSLRGVGDETVEQGEPLRIAVRLDAPRDSTAAIELAPASGTWSDAITVELAPAGGGPAVARAEAVGQPATPHASLSVSQVAGGLWRFSTEALQRVAVGDYVVRARLAIRTGRGWTGEVTSDETPLRVVSVSDSAARIAQRTANRAQAAILDGRIEEAAAIVDEVLKRSPNDEALLAVRADIAERAGNPQAAMMCLNRFLRLRTGTGSGQPPIELDELRGRITSALLAENAPPAEPPAWSWPPAAVLAARVDEVPAPATATAVTNAAPSPAAVPLAPTPASPVKAAEPKGSPQAVAPAASSTTGVGRVVPVVELNEATILADPASQWAVSATASSQHGPVRYAPAQATGAPNIPLGMAGDNPDAWCPASRNEGTAWLELVYARPVHATEVRVRQNAGAGGLAKVEAIEPNGTAHVWWEGVDPHQGGSGREITWFAVRVPKTSYLVARIKLTLNLAASPGWEQIDAVQIVAP